jgi:hypothetical protein
MLILKRWSLRSSYYRLENYLKYLQILGRLIQIGLMVEVQNVS